MRSTPGTHKKYMDSIRIYVVRSRWFCVASEEYSIKNFFIFIALKGDLSAHLLLTKSPWREEGRDVSPEPGERVTQDRRVPAGWPAFSHPSASLSALGEQSKGIPGVSHLVIWVADSEVAHTDDDLMKEAFAGDLAAVAQQGAGNVPECQGQALRPYNRLTQTRGSENSEPGESRGCKPQ